MSTSDPYFYAASLAAGIAATIGGWEFLRRVIDKSATAKSKAAILAEREAHAKADAEQREKDRVAMRAMMREIAAEAFTGRAEADAHRHAEAMNHYRVALTEALDRHTKEERAYVDNLRHAVLEKMTEVLVKTEGAIQDAKRIAFHVSHGQEELRNALADLRRADEQRTRELSELRALVTTSRAA